MLYIIQPGDYLRAISMRFGVSIKHLLQLNPMAYYPLCVGQRLFIPLPHSRALVTYTVTTGDTLDSIAKNFNTTKESIKQLNNLSSEVLVPGQKLKINTGSRISSPNSRALVTYTVTTGDTLDSIAQNFNTTKESIKQLNNLSSEVVVPGQKLRINTGSRISSSGSSLRKNYIVEVGDTLDSIAQKFKVTKGSLMSLNNLSSDFIFPGQELKIDSRSAKIDSPSEKTYGSYRPLATYTIQVGDTLDTIARKFNTTKKALMELNGLVSEALKAGDTLNVEVSREYSAKTTVSPQSDVNINSKYDFFSIHDSGLNKSIKIWKELGKENTFFFVSKMSVTAAGASTAFHKENQLAFDFLDNAGNDGYWWSLVTDDQGVPLIQGIDDPSPGYFISKTALSDCQKPLKDPKRYVDATVIPYITLPTRHMMGAKLGDLCVVINTQNNKIGYAIVGDVGPDDSPGIGSVALAKDIDIVSSPKIGGVDDGILYIIFSQSGEGWCKVKTREQVINDAQWLFKQWGGIEKVHALFGKFPLSYNNIQ